MITNLTSSLACRWIALCAVALGAGCHHKSQSTSATAAATQAATQPAARPATPTAGGGTYLNQKAGIRLDYPAGWSPKPSKDYELLLVPAAAQAGERSISLDVPDLPPHIPGMIPIGMVKNGYLDDLRKNVGTIQTREETPTIPKAQARLVVSTWQKDGKSFSDAALMLVHSDRVYILRAASDAAGERQVREAFDAIARSLQWVK